MIEKKVLILVPNDHRPGGIANYYRVLHKYLSQYVEYFKRGEGRPGENGIQKIKRLLRDYAGYRKRVRSGRYKIVVLNSSLGTGGFFRDFVFIMLTPENLKTIVFFRGWNPNFEKKIENSFFLRKLMEFTFLNTNQLIVLSSVFKDRLLKWGYKNKINIETTLVEESLLKNVSIKKLLKTREDIKVKTLLYVGSIHKEKGVREITKSLGILRDQTETHSVKFNLAGVGSDVQLLRRKGKKENLPLHFLGYVRGNDKVNAFMNANLFVFASYHEGMPNAVLEAISFGLPVLTTRVGGIPDFFEEGKMGLFLDNREPEHIAIKIKYLLDRLDLMKQMSEYNYNYAKEHFYASKVAARLEKIIDDVAEGSV